MRIDNSPTMARPKKHQDTEADGATAKEDRQFVTALARGLEILRCFSASRTELGTMDIAQLTGLPQPTVWRLCHTLVRCGYLAPAPTGEKLRVAPAVLGLGFAALATLDIGEIARYGMQRLADDFRVASSLAAADRLEMVIVQRVTSADATLLVNLHVGSRLPMGTSSFGWAYLAGIGEQAREPLLGQLAHRYADTWPQLSRRLETAFASYEKRGYVINSGEYHRDINAIAVPVIPRNGGQVLVVNLGGPAAVVTVKKLEREVAPRLMELAQSIGAALTATGAPRGR